MSNPELSFLSTLEHVIRQRLQSPVAGSYTSELAARGRQRIAQKVGEEAVELVLASVCGTRNETIDEAADLLYHILVMLGERDIALADIVARLEQRHAS